MCAKKSLCKRTESQTRVVFMAFTNIPMSFVLDLLQLTSYMLSPLLLLSFCVLIYMEMCHIYGISMESALFSLVPHFI